MPHILVLLTKMSYFHQEPIFYSISNFLISNRSNVKYYYSRTNVSNLRSNPLLES